MTKALSLARGSHNYYCNDISYYGIRFKCQSNQLLHAWKQEGVFFAEPSYLIPPPPICAYITRYVTYV